MEPRSQKNWWQRNWKWFLPVFLMFSLLMAILLVGATNDNFNRFGSAYMNQHLYEEAFQLSIENEQVRELLGDNITKMSMIFGEVTLNEDETEMQLVLTIGGDKSKGKLLIWANKTGEVWKSKTIKVRKTISPIETVTILE